MHTLILTEEQFEKCCEQLIHDSEVNETAYPSSFSMEEFAKCNSFAARVRYCQARLPRLGSGSARITYQIDNEKALKLAKNPKGIAQNKAEENSYAIEAGIGANVYNSDPNGLWIEMELARKVKKSDFKKLLGVSFELVQNYVLHLASWYSRRGVSYDHQYDDVFDEIDNDNYPNWEWFQSLRYYMTDTGLEAYGDLTRLSSYGIVTRNGQEEIVLIDFGLDDDVWADYYKKR